MDLDALIRALAPSEVAGARPVDIRDLAYDTRAVTSGAAFFSVMASRMRWHMNHAVL